MTSKKPFVYPPGILRQPRRTWTEAEFMELHKALFDVHEVPYIEPFDLRNPPTVPRASLEAAVRELSRAHEPLSAKDVEAGLAKLTRAELVDKLGRLTSAYVPACQMARKNPGRNLKWPLSRRIVLFSRMEQVLQKNAEFGWSIEKAAEHLLPKYPDIKTPKALARKVREIRAERGVTALRWSENREARCAAFIDALPPADRGKLIRFMELCGYATQAHIDSLTEATRCELEDLLSDPVIGKFNFQQTPLADIWDEWAEDLESEGPGGELANRIDSLEADTPPPPPTADTK